MFSTIVCVDFIVISSALLYKFCNLTFKCKLVTFVLVSFFKLNNFLVKSCLLITSFNLMYFSVSSYHLVYFLS